MDCIGNRSTKNSDKREDVSEGSALGQTSLGPKVDKLFDDRANKRRALQPLVKYTVDYILEAGLKTPKIFVKEPPSKSFRHAMDVFKEGKIPDFDQYNRGSLVAASVLKCYLTTMPVPFTGIDNFPRILETGDLPPYQRFAETFGIVNSLHSYEFDILKTLIGLMRLISERSAKNGMTAEKLCAVLAGAIVRDPDQLVPSNKYPTERAIQCVQYLIANCPILFCRSSRNIPGHWLMPSDCAHALSERAVLKCPA